jgi:hypothetical protein
MASIQEIYVYPWCGGNTTGMPWDPNRPMQNWARPLEDGEDPLDYVQFWTYVPETRVGTETMRVGFLMTKGEASKVNIVAPDDPANHANPDPTAYWTMPPAQIPMRELEEGESLVNTPWGLKLTVSE